MFMRRRRSVLLAAVLALSIGLLANADAARAQGPTMPGLPDAPLQTPVDGGLGLLALAGSALAAKRLRGRDMRDV